jgi:signal transduction histidine kinase
MDTFLKRLATGHPASLRIFLLFLGTTFVCELGIMLALAAALPRDMPPVVASLADATILTLTLAPAVWWLFVLPARRLTESRSRLLERVLSAQEDERRRIAADLHDGLGQSLTSVQLRLAAIEEAAGTSAVRERVAATRSVVAGALDDIRRLVRDTRPPVLDDLGLVAALENLLTDVAGAAGLESSFSYTGDRSVRLPAPIETAVFRSVQEALTNAVRHADAGRLDVTMRRDTDSIVVGVADDGCGFDVAGALRGPRQPFGILGMQERMATLGGDVEITSRPAVARWS